MEVAVLKIKRFLYLSTIISLGTCVIGASVEGRKFKGFVVTWADPKDPNPLAFTPLPRTSKEAQQQNWTVLDNGCNDDSLNYLGSRYILNDDVSVFPIYDGKGNVAGIQSAISQEIADKNGVVDYSKLPAMHQVAIKGKKVYVMTAYFIDPSKICKGRSKTELEDQGTMTDLFIQDGKGKYVKQPSTADKKKLAAEDWRPGNCVPAMGKHYYLGIERNMDCAKQYPFFLLYDEINNPVDLLGFGFLTMGKYPSGRYEYPAKNALLMSINPVPDCLPSAFDTAGGVTSFHVFFHEEPRTITCAPKTT